MFFFYNLGIKLEHGKMRKKNATKLVVFPIWKCVRNMIIRIVLMRKNEKVDYNIFEMFIFKSNVQKCHSAFLFEK